MAITSFRGPDHFLSNFYPCFITVEDEVYPTVENAYQASKTLDEPTRRDFIYLTPMDAKRYGKEITIRADWECIKLDVMEGLLKQKFKVGSDLAQKLMNTGEEELVEGNHWHDTYWGQCPLGNGENHLGKLLMKVRADLRRFYNGE
jgi:ribA/ribD-fused uncharacterized protein